MQVKMSYKRMLSAALFLMVASGMTLTASGGFTEIDSCMIFSAVFVTNETNSRLIFTSRDRMLLFCTAPKDVATTAHVLCRQTASQEPHNNTRLPLPADIGYLQTHALCTGNESCIEECTSLVWELLPSKDGQCELIKCDDVSENQVSNLGECDQCKNKEETNDRGVSTGIPPLPEYHVTKPVSIVIPHNSSDTASQPYSSSQQHAKHDRDPPWRADKTLHMQVGGEWSILEDDGRSSLNYSQIVPSAAPVLLSKLTKSLDRRESIELLNDKIKLLDDNEPEDGNGSTEDNEQNNDLPRIPYDSERNTEIEVSGEGFITSPEYPEPYTNSMNVSWTLVSTDDSPILLLIIDFLTEKDIDLLKIYDHNRNLLSTLSGDLHIYGRRHKRNTGGSIVQINDSKLHLEFTSDSYKSFRGFNITYNIEISPSKFDQLTSPEAVAWLDGNVIAVGTIIGVIGLIIICIVLLYYLTPERHHRFRTRRRSRRISPALSPSSENSLRENIYHLSSDIEMQNMLNRIQHPPKTTRGTLIEDCVPSQWPERKRAWQPNDNEGMSFSDYDRNHQIGYTANKKHFHQSQNSDLACHMPCSMTGRQVASYINSRAQNDLNHPPGTPVCPPPAFSPCEMKQAAGSKKQRPYTCISKERSGSDCSASHKWSPFGRLRVSSEGTGITSTTCISERNQQQSNNPRMQTSDNVSLVPTDLSVVTPVEDIYIIPENDTRQLYLEQAQSSSATEWKHQVENGEQKSESGQMQINIPKLAGDMGHSTVKGNNRKFQFPTNVQFPDDTNCPKFNNDSLNEKAITGYISLADTTIMGGVNDEKNITTNNRLNKPLSHGCEESIGLKESKRKQKKQTCTVAGVQVKQRADLLCASYLYSANLDETNDEITTAQKCKTQRNEYFRKPTCGLDRVKCNSNEEPSSVIDHTAVQRKDQISAAKESKKIHEEYVSTESCDDEKDSTSLENTSTRIPKHDSLNKVKYHQSNNPLREFVHPGDKAPIVCDNSPRRPKTVSCFFESDSSIEFDVKGQDLKSLSEKELTDRKSPDLYCAIPCQNELFRTYEITRNDSAISKSAVDTSHTEYSENYGMTQEDSVDSDSHVERGITPARTWIPPSDSNPSVKARCRAIAQETPLTTIVPLPNIHSTGGNRSTIILKELSNQSPSHDHPECHSTGCSPMSCVISTVTTCSPNSKSVACSPISFLNTVKKEPHGQHYHSIIASSSFSVKEFSTHSRDVSSSVNEESCSDTFQASSNQNEVSFSESSLSSSCISCVQSEASIETRISSKSAVRSDLDREITAISSVREHSVSDCCSSDSSIGSEKCEDNVSMNSKISSEYQESLPSTSDDSNYEDYSSDFSTMNSDSESRADSSNARSIHVPVLYPISNESGACTTHYNTSSTYSLPKQATPLRKRRVRLYKNRFHPSKSNQASEPRSPRRKVARGGFILTAGLAGTIAGVSLPNPEPLREFICPITGAVMSDPVIASNKKRYDREAITDWFLEHSTWPGTRQIMADSRLQTDYVLASRIRNWKSVKHQKRMRVRREIRKTAATFLSTINS